MVGTVAVLALTSGCSGPGIWAGCTPTLTGAGPRSTPQSPGIPGGARSARTAAAASRHAQGRLGPVGEDSGESMRRQGLVACTDVFAVVTAKILPPFETNSDGVTLRLSQAIGSTGDGVQLQGVEQHWTLRLRTPEPEPLDVPLRWPTTSNTWFPSPSDTQPSRDGSSAPPRPPGTVAGGTPLAEGMRHDVTYYVRWSNCTAHRATRPRPMTCTSLSTTSLSRTHPPTPPGGRPRRLCARAVGGTRRCGRRRCWRARGTGCAATAEAWERLYG